MSAIPQSGTWRISCDLRAQIKGVLIAIAFAYLFRVELNGLMYKWYNEADWSHGWAIPLFSGYLVYSRWEQLRRTPIRDAWVGLLIILAGLGTYQYATWGIQIGYIRPASMLLALLGVIITMCGLPAMRYLWVPWLYLFFAIPLPKGVYFQLTDPMRQIAAVAATNVLHLTGVDIETVGSTIQFWYQGNFGQLGVADACSGMRSTMTLCALGVAVAFMTPRSVWKRIILLASCVPIAIFANLIRVTVTCILYIFVDKRYADGTYHTLLGLVTMLIAFGIFFGLGWVLDHLVVTADDESAATKTKPA